MSNLNYNQPNTLIVAPGKSIVIAYVLWFFLGNIGIHRFYLNSPFTGIMMIAFTVIGWATTPIVIGFFILGLLWLWLLFDIFWILAKTGKINNRQMNDLAAKMSK